MTSMGSKRIITLRKPISILGSVLLLFIADPSPARGISYNDVLKTLENNFLVVEEIRPDLNADGKNDLILIIREKDRPRKNRRNDNPDRLRVYLAKGPNAYDEVFENRTMFENLFDWQVGVEVSFTAIKRGFEARLKDRSDDAFFITMKFRWENGDFRLTGSTIEVSPRMTVKSDDGETLQGRWQCKQDTNWLTGDRIQEGPGMKMGGKRTKILQKDKPAKYLNADQLRFESDYLESFCSPKANAVTQDVDLSKLIERTNQTCKKFRMWIDVLSNFVEDEALAAEVIQNFAKECSAITKLSRKWNYSGFRLANASFVQTQMVSEDGTKRIKELTVDIETLDESHSMLQYVQDNLPEIRFSDLLNRFKKAGVSVDIEYVDLDQDEPSALDFVEENFDFVVASLKELQLKHFVLSELSWYSSDQPLNWSSGLSWSLTSNRTTEQLKEQFDADLAKLKQIGSIESKVRALTKKPHFTITASFSEVTTEALAQLRQDLEANPGPWQKLLQWSKEPSITLAGMETPARSCQALPSLDLSSKEMVPDAADFTWEERVAGKAPCLLYKKTP